jgi:hypothetical protein
VLHHRFKIPTYKTQNGCTGKDVGPTCGFATSPGVGPGATVSTLRIRYPRIQAPSQDKRQGVPACPKAPSPASWLRAAPGPPRVPGSCLPAQGSSRAAACPHGPGSRLSARGSPEAATCPHGSGSRLPSRGGSRATACRLGSSTCLLAQGSSGAVTCPEDGLQAARN